MKERYVKPDLRVEYFTLSQSVAANCGAGNLGNEFGKPAHQTKESCGWDLGFGGMVIWTRDLNCTEFLDPNGSFNGICYNNPEGGFSIFGS